MTETENEEQTFDLLEWYLGQKIKRALHELKSAEIHFARLCCAREQLVSWDHDEPLGDHLAEELDSISFAELKIAAKELRLKSLAGEISRKEKR